MEDQTPQTPPAPWYSRALSTVLDWLTVDINFKHRFDYDIDLHFQPWHVLLVISVINLVWRLI